MWKRKKLRILFHPYIGIWHFTGRRRPRRATYAAVAVSVNQLIIIIIATCQNSLPKFFFFHYYGYFFILLLFFSRSTFCMSEPDQFYYKNVMNLRITFIYIIIIYIYAIILLFFVIAKKKQNFATVCKSAAAMVAVSNYRRKFQTCIIIYTRASGI